MMSSLVVFEDLPYDVLEEISKYLSPSDLNNCCGVNRKLRNYFIQDLLWKRHCNEDLVTFLKSTPSEVCGTRNFNIKRCNVTQEGEWRVNYMYQNKLWYNWIHGRYKEKNLIKLCGVSGSPYIRFEFYNNNILFFIETKSIKIYNTSLHFTICSRQVSYNLPSFCEDNTSFHKVTNDKFLVSANTFVKVFDISLSHDWPVSFTFVLDKTEEESTAVIHNPYGLHHKSLGMYFQSCVEVATEDIYVGIVETGDFLFKNVLMHIWNYRTKKKLKVERVPFLCSPKMSKVSLRNSKTPSNNILVDITVSLDLDKGMLNTHHYFVYNLTTLTFYPLRVSCTYPLDTVDSEFGEAILSSYLYVMNAEGLSLYDYNKRCHVFRWYPYFGSVFMNIVGNSIISLNSNKDMEVLRLKRGNIETFHGDFNFCRCSNLWDEFVMFDCMRSRADVAVWYLGKRPKRILPLYGRYMSHNKFCTKLLLKRGDSIFLLSFW